MTDQTVPVTMSLPRHLVALLDNAADADGRSRSAMASRILAGALASDAAAKAPHPPLVPVSFLEGLQRSPVVSNDAELKAAQARALAEAKAADAACRAAAQQSPAQRVPAKEGK